MNGVLVVRDVGSVVDAMLKKSREVIAAYQAGNDIELQDLYHDVLNETPMDTGALRRSIAVTSRRTREGVAGKIGANTDGSAPYAIYVHEINKRYRVGKWKYLEDPWKLALPGWDERVGAHVAAILK